MPDKKLTDSEIVKALECCIESNSCSKCPFANIADIRICTSEMSKNSLDLINRLQAENEDFKFLYENLKVEHLETIKAIKYHKAEAYKEFAERLKNETFKIDYCSSIYNVVDVDDIDNLVREMVGEDK